MIAALERVEFAVAKCFRQLEEVTAATVADVARMQTALAALETQADAHAQALQRLASQHAGSQSALDSLAATAAALVPAVAVLEEQVRLRLDADRAADLRGGGMDRPVRLADSPVIDLNVGGTVFTTRVSTLCSVRALRSLVAR